MLSYRELRRVYNGDFYDRSIDEREMLLRMVAMGDDVLLPEIELNEFKGGIVWRLFDWLKGQVKVESLIGMGLGLWTFYDRGMYSDQWIEGAYRCYLSAGGGNSILIRLREDFCVPEDVLDGLRDECRGIDASCTSVIDSATNKYLSKKMSDWSEADWEREMQELLDDAKKDGVKGYAVRKDILVLIGKRKGFIGEDSGDVLAGFLTSLKEQGRSVLQRASRRAIEVDCEVVDDEISRD